MHVEIKKKYQRTPHIICIHLRLANVKIQTWDWLGVVYKEGLVVVVEAPRTTNLFESTQRKEPERNSSKLLPW